MGFVDFPKPRREIISEEGIEGIIDLANLSDPTRTKIKAKRAELKQKTMLEGKQCNTAMTNGTEIVS